jgi:hypothetical protein
MGIEAPMVTTKAINPTAPPKPPKPARTRGDAAVDLGRAVLAVPASARSN